MEAERWRQISQLYNEAQLRPVPERAAFLRQACAGDATLRGEVELLLAQVSVDGFLEEPAIAQIVSDPSPMVMIGRRLGPYRVLTLLGRGAMGEVYRARDTTLDRDVAIKIVSGAFTREPDRLARFEREARVLATLNHPHIGAIYGVEEADGIRGLILELVEGETLGERIARARRSTGRPLELKDALDIARQIATALEAAHEKGIVHRDLKPANIKITPDGVAKVLDFGLAKAVTVDGANARAGSQAPTMTTTGTIEGTIVGTVPYMSPEQTRSLPVDKRTDIWAFGCVLYEMLTGRLAFPGATVSDTFVAILDREPDWSALPENTPPGILKLLRRCLEKDPKARLRDIGEARIQLEAKPDIPALLSSRQGDTAPLSRPVLFTLLACAVAGLIAVCLVKPQSEIVSKLPLTFPPEVLSEKAREIIEGLGYTGGDAEVISGFQYDQGNFQFVSGAVSGTDNATQEWGKALSAEPSLLFFWYRQSPASLIRPLDAFTLGRVGPADSPIDSPGVVSVDLDLNGNLLRFATSPPLSETPVESPAPMSDWSPLFSAARLDPSRFVPAAVGSKSPSVIADARAAWQGVYPGTRELPVRVEAAAFRGRVIYFEVLFPWTRPAAAPAESASNPPFPWGQWFDYLLLAVFLVMLAFAGQNWKAGDADSSGAFRIGLCTCAAYMLSVVLGASQVEAMLSGGFFTVFTFGAAFGVGNGVAYYALQLWVSQHWPDVLSTWNRILEGHWRDPAVGRDLFVAVCCATLSNAAHSGLHLVVTHLGSALIDPTTSQFGFGLQNLMGGRFVAAEAVGVFLRSLDMLFFLFVLVAARAILGNRWLAAVVFLVFWYTILAAPFLAQGDWLASIDWALELCGLLLLISTCGLFAAVAFGAVALLIRFTLLTTDFGAWYGQSSFVAVLVVSLLTLIAFRISLAGRPLFDVEMIRDRR